MRTEQMHLVAQMKWAELWGTLIPTEEIEQQSQLGTSYEKSKAIYQATGS
jgi:hypothetical protein